MKSNFKNLTHLFPLYFLFFTSTDTVLFGTNSNNLFLYIPRIVGLIVSIYLLFFKNKGKIRDAKRSLLVLLMFILIAVSGLVNSMNVNTLLSRLLIIITAFSIVEAYSKDEYFIAFDNTLFLISIVALFTEMIAYIYPSLFNLFPTETNTAGYTFSVFFFGSMRYSFLNSALIRAEGIFWEPGAFAIYLVLGIINQLFLIDKVNVKKLVIYLITLLFTFSTTGFISAAFVFLIYLFFGKKQNKRINALIVSLILSLTLITIFEDSIFDFLFGKIINRESTTITRYSSFFSGLQVAFSNPFFGVGANGLGEYVSNASASLGYGGAYSSITNTFVYQLAAYGIPYGVLYLIGTFKFFKRDNGLLLSLGLFVSIFLLYFGEVFFSFFPLIIVFYGFSSNQTNFSKI